MTNPNWWDVEPYCEDNYPIIEGRTVLERIYNVPLIIEKAKEMTTQENTHVIGDPLPGVCNGCGRASWE